MKKYIFIVGLLAVCIGTNVSFASTSVCSTYETGTITQAVERTTAGTSTVVESVGVIRLHRVIIDRLTATGKTIVRNPTGSLFFSTVAGRLDIQSEAITDTPITFQNDGTSGNDVFVRIEYHTPSSTPESIVTCVSDETSSTSTSPTSTPSITSTSTIIHSSEALMWELYLLLDALEFGLAMYFVIRLWKYLFGL